MPDPGERRPAARIGLVVVLLAALGGGIWWWKHARANSAPATATMTQSQHGSGSNTAVTQRDAPVEPAKLAITESDDKGPLAGATVRLAPKDGEIVVVKTGGDGGAPPGPPEPGAGDASAAAAG